MARFSRLDVLNTMIETGLVPLFYKPDVEPGKNLVRACAEGGANVIEFTNRGDGALAVFSELIEYAAKELPGVILGAGTIVDAPTAALYLAAGSNFVVGQNFNQEVALLCNRRKVAYLPGCATPTEIANAEAMGVEIVKVFPSFSVGGPAFVKSVLEPCPWTRIMPTGGIQIDEESISAWFKAGVSCVGVGSHLLREDWIASGDFAKITELTRTVLGRIRSARG
jgi:2-dehydro-3-deoxyphosphogluconate aldolase/(4S)-4-hydroxy-2-oxoglutarate aldolase